MRALFLFFLVSLVFWPGVVRAQEDAEKVNACVQDVYDKVANKTLEEDLVPALKKCYANTALEQYVHFPEEQPFVIDGFQFKDVFTDPRAQVDLQKAYGSITRNLTLQESQKVVSCFEGIKSRYALSGPPSSALQKEFANCYQGTSFEPIAQVYAKIADRVDCSYERLGARRVVAIVRTQQYTAHELALVQKCIIERAAAVTTGIAAVNTVAALGVYNSWALVYFFATQPFLLLTLRRRKAQWGTIYNRFTHLPVDLGIVRVHKDEKVMRTRVTDASGRYFFFVEPSTYALSITKQDFVTISGVRIQAPQGIVNPDMGIEPIIRERTSVQLRLRNLRRNVHRFVAYVSPVVAVGAATVSPKWWMVALAAVSVLLTYVFHKKFSLPKPTSFGFVVDARTGQPVANAMVRLFSLPWNKMVDSVLTDRKGRYAFLVGEGTYVTTVQKQGYQLFTSGQIRKEATDNGWISAKAELVL